MPRPVYAEADWVGVAPALRKELEAKLKPGERVLWVQQAKPALGRLLLTECHSLWVVVLVLILLAGMGLPMETAPRESGGTVLRMGGTAAFLWKDGDLSALRTGAILGVAAFALGLLTLAWKAYKMSRLWKEVYALTDRRLLYLRPFLLDRMVDAVPLHHLTVLNRVEETLHRADIFVSYPRLCATSCDYGAPQQEIIETIRLRGILAPAAVEEKLRGDRAGQGLR